MNLGEKIAKERKKAGITQVEIAESLCTKQTNISYTEKHLSKNSALKYLWYIRKRGVDLNEIFDSTEI